MTEESKRFYEEQYRGSEYAPVEVGSQHTHYRALERFVSDFRLENAKCLEVGCGRGAFQDLVRDYTGVDVAESVRPYLRKSFVSASATDLPFEDGAFDAIWSITVLEHVPNPELALLEVRRVLRDGGLLYLAPAWQCRSWAAEGYPVRPYCDLGWKGKVIKASIPFRNSVWFRCLYTLPRRCLRLLGSLLWRGPTRFRYRKLRPNYQQYWMSDSDAVNSMDPYECIVWFESRGDTCLSHRTGIRRLLVRTGALVIRISKSERTASGPRSPKAGAEVSCQ